MKGVTSRQMLHLTTGLPSARVAQRVHWLPRYVVSQALQRWIDRISRRNCHHASSRVRPRPLIKGLCPDASTLYLSKRGVARDRVMSTEWMLSESVVMAGTSERISRMTKPASASREANGSGSGGRQD